MSSLDEDRKRQQVKWLRRLKTFDTVEKWYKLFPSIPEYKPRLTLTDPSPFWHTFPRQKQAFDFAASYPEEVHVFAFEKGDPTTANAPKGLRRYLATNYPQLWHVIHSFADRNKHATFYEVIQEGAACKLYFDLEFSKEVNPEHNGDEMVELFTKFVCKQIQQEFKLNCSQRHVIDLDASTESKFSRHLIFNLPKGAVFKDNINAGNFVQHLCKEIIKQSETPQADGTDEDGETATKKPRLDDETSGKQETTTQADHSSLLVKNTSGEQVLFVDRGVYTRNRNFRLYKCSKLSRANPLKVASTNCYTPKHDKKLPKSKSREDYQLFLDSIITNVRFSQDIQVLTFEGDSSTKPKLAPHNESTGTDAKANTSLNTSSSADEPLEGSHHSPYPDIDNFIKMCVREGGIQGGIRRWLYFTQGQMLIYDISNNRWCGRIARQHKSNNIMILVDLKRGIYYQKCHDPDCRAQNYKSPEHPIPPDCLPAFFDEFDDDELLAATEQAEQKQNQGKEHLGLEKRSASGATVGNQSCSGGHGDADVSWEEDGVLDITDEEMLAAVSGLEDSGIEN